MLRITYQTYSPILEREFTEYGEFRTVEEFRLFAYSLFSGNWSIIKIDNAQSDFEANTKRIEDCYKLRTKLAD